LDSAYFSGPRQVYVNQSDTAGVGNRKGKRYPITVEALKTRWQRDRAKAALVLPSVADQVA
jgi:hypothetical protein